MTKLEKAREKMLGYNCLCQWKMDALREEYDSLKNQELSKIGGIT